MEKSHERIKLMSVNLVLTTKEGKTRIADPDPVSLVGSASEFFWSDPDPEFPKGRIRLRLFKFRKRIPIWKK